MILLPDQEHPNAAIVKDGTGLYFARNATAYRFVLQPSAQRKSKAVEVPPGVVTVRLAVAGRPSELPRIPSAVLKVAIETCVAENAVDGLNAWTLAHQFEGIDTDCGGSASATVQSAGFLRVSWYAIPADGRFESLVLRDGSTKPVRFSVDVE